MDTYFHKIAFSTSKLFLLFFFLPALSACCWYWPLVDTTVLFDYSERTISFNTDRLIDNNEVQINLWGKLFIANKCRSKKLRLMFARFDLLIEKNSNNDTLTLDLNQAKVCLTDGREVLAGTVVRSDRDISECFLVIIGNKFYFKQGDLVSNTIDFDFRYPKGFDIEHFRPSITVDWIGFRTNNKQFLPTRKIEGFVQQ